MKWFDALTQPEADFASQNKYVIALAGAPIGDHQGFKVFKSLNRLFLGGIELDILAGPACVARSTAYGICSGWNFFEQSALSQLADEVFAAGATSAPVSAGSTGEI